MKNLLTLIAILMSVLSFSQNDSLDRANSAKSYDFSSSSKIIKVSPLEIFSRIPTFSVDLETRIDEDVSLQFGFGVIPSFAQILVGQNSNKFDRLRGYNLRGESRFFILKKANRYISAGFSLRHIVIRDVVPVGMEPFVDSPQQQDFAYFVNTPMKFHRFNTEFSTKFGIQKTFSKNFVADFFIGIRLIKINVQSFSKVPDGGIVAPNWNNNFTLTDNFRDSKIRMTAGFKVGYKFK